VSACESVACGVAGIETCPRGLVLGGGVGMWGVFCVCVLDQRIVECEDNIKTCANVREGEKRN
jgi:hypothetical protein